MELIKANINKIEAFDELYEYNKISNNANWKLINELNKKGQSKIDYFQIETVESQVKNDKNIDFKYEERSLLNNTDRLLHEDVRISTEHNNKPIYDRKGNNQNIQNEELQAYRVSELSRL